MAARHALRCNGRLQPRLQLPEQARGEHHIHPQRVNLGDLHHRLAPGAGLGDVAGVEQAVDDDTVERADHRAQVQQVERTPVFDLGEFPVLEAGL